MPFRTRGRRARPSPHDRHLPAHARLRAGAALAALAIFAMPSSAAAHAALVTIDPADGAAVTGSPAEIVGTFTQNLDPAKSSFTVVDATGAVVAQGGLVQADEPRTMTLTLTEPLDPGRYTVRWTTLSTEDGELDRDTTTFTVSAAPATSAPPASAPASAVASAEPSVATIVPSVAPSPSATPTSPTTTTSDALIPIVAAVLVIATLGLWLTRGRKRAGR